MIEILFVGIGLLRERHPLLLLQHQLVEDDLVDAPPALVATLIVQVLRERWVFFGVDGDPGLLLELLEVLVPLRAAQLDLVLLQLFVQSIGLGCISEPREFWGR